MNISDFIDYLGSNAFWNDFNNLRIVNKELLLDNMLLTVSLGNRIVRKDYLCLRGRSDVD